MSRLHPAILAASFLWLGIQSPAAELAGDPGSVESRMVVYEKKVTKDLDPFVAEDFLKDEAALNYLTATAPVGLTGLFRDAVQLKDFKEALVIYGTKDPLALRARLQYLVKSEGDEHGFLSPPKNLLAWEGRYCGFLSPAVAEKAVWEWSALAAIQQQWLLSRKITADQWASVDFTARGAWMGQWWAAFYRDFLKQDPNRMRVVAHGNWDILDYDQKKILNETIKVAVKNPKALSDPGLLKLLADSNDRQSVGDQRTLLNQIYDRLRLSEGSSSGVAAGPGLSPQDRAWIEGTTFSQMLGQAVLKEIGSVDIGKRVQNFYKTHALNVAIAKGDGFNGGFQGGPHPAIFFPEKMVLDWLKGNQLQPRDFLTNAGALKGFAAMLAPTFVHESTHYEQWAAAIRSPAPADREMYSSYAEVEAFARQAQYVLEKAAKDKKFLDALRLNAPRFGFVFQNLDAARALWRDPQNYQNHVLAMYYASQASLDEKGMSHVSWDRRPIDLVREELNRRLALPASQQAALERGDSVLPVSFPKKTDEESRRVLERVSTAGLRKGLAEWVGVESENVGVYETQEQQHARLIGDVQNTVAVLRKDPVAVQNLAVLSESSLK